MTFTVKDMRVSVKVSFEKAPLHVKPSGRMEFSELLEQFSRDMSEVPFETEAVSFKNLKESINE
ncbi:MAG: hypothetical protein JW802_06855 [Campylobacterales bacterium]|nr:hypothetical protein [Campylobacterales bacterium]